MGKKEVILCDTNILLGYLRNDTQAVVQLSRLTDEFTDWGRLAISVVTYGEVLPSSKKKDRRTTRAFLNNFQIIDLDKAVSKLAKELFNETFYYQGMLADCLIAASAISNGLKVWTLNRNDFRHFKGIRFFTFR